MSVKEIITYFCLIIGGFLLGGVMFSRIVPLVFFKRDVCRLNDDANPGAANVFKSCGVFLGLACLALDMFKGFLPVYAAFDRVNTNRALFAVLMAAPVLGHAIAPFNRFHGGKCIATSFGVLLAVLPVSRIVFLLAAIYIIFSTVIKINPTRRRSIITFSLFGILSVLISVYFKHYPVAFGCLIISVTAVLKHLRQPQHSAIADAAGKTI